MHTRTPHTHLEEKTLGVAMEKGDLDQYVDLLAAQPEGVGADLQHLHACQFSMFLLLVITAVGAPAHLFACMCARVYATRQSAYARLHEHVRACMQVGERDEGARLSESAWVKMCMCVYV